MILFFFFFLYDFPNDKSILNTRFGRVKNSVRRCIYTAVGSFDTRCKQAAAAWWSDVSGDRWSPRNYRGGAKNIEKLKIIIIINGGAYDIIIMIICACVCICIINWIPCGVMEQKKNKKIQFYRHTKIKLLQGPSRRGGCCCTCLPLLLRTVRRRPPRGVWTPTERAKIERIKNARPFITR